MRYTLELARMIANEKGGKFLDNEFIDSKYRHSWECRLGHVFPKSIERIVSGEWCSVCSGGKSERFCRFCIEQIIGKPFPKRKDFDWLRNAAGNKMELDGFCAELQIGFEYQGKQHYDQIARFHSGHEDLNVRKKDDAQKRELCAKHEISLIEVPYTVDPSEMEVFLKDQLTKVYKGTLYNVDYSKYTFEPEDSWNAIEKIANKNGGEIIRLLNKENKLYAECYCPKHQHTWEALVSSVRTGRWCKKCGYEKSKEKDPRIWRLENLKEFARERGGKCLSEKYNGKDEELVWKCSVPEHPEYRRAPSKVVNSKYLGCFECSKKKRIGIEDMILHAKRHNGRCITQDLPERGKSMVYFECVHHPDHPRFAKKASELKNNPDLWCPNCEGGKVYKHSISAIKELASQHGYECLSTTYENNHEPLMWRCLTCTYIWPANFRVIQRKTNNHECWCDKCILQKKLRLPSSST